MTPQSLYIGDRITNPRAASTSSTPSSLPTDGTKIILVAPPTSWASWTSAERNGVIAACTVAGLALLAILTTVIYLTLKRRRLTKRHERGPFPASHSNGGRRRSRSRIRELAGLAHHNTKSLTSTESDSKRWWRKTRTPKPRGIEGLEDVELGSAAARARLESSRGATAGREGYELGLMSGGLQGGGQRFSRASGEEGWIRVVGSREELGAERGGGGVGRGKRQGTFHLGRESEADRVRRG